MGRTMIAALIGLALLSACDGIQGNAEPIDSINACQQRMADMSIAFAGATVKGTFIYSAADGKAFRSLLPADPAAEGVIGSAVLGNGEAARRAFLAKPAGDVPEILAVDPRALVKIGYGPVKVEQVVASGCERISGKVFLEHARLDRVEAEPPQDKST